MLAYLCFRFCQVKRQKDLPETNQTFGLSSSHGYPAGETAFVSSIRCPFTRLRPPSCCRDAFLDGPHPLIFWTPTSWAFDEISHDVNRIIVNSCGGLSGKRKAVSQLPDGDGLPSTLLTSCELYQQDTRCCSNGGPWATPSFETDVQACHLV